MQTTLLSILIIIIIIGFLVIAYLIKYYLGEHQQSSLEKVVAATIGTSVPHITAQSKEVLSAEKALIKQDLDSKHTQIKELVARLEKQIDQRQQQLQESENQRAKTFSKLTTQIEQQFKLTQDLKVSADQLASVLSNNQQRGEWGERIIEDLLTANGLVKGVHFVQQQKLPSTGLRPDVTLLLPNERIVPIDVKFPYSELHQMSKAQTKKSKDQHLKQFERDLKTKISKIATYISPEDATLDYAIMFVPSEMVFSFINQNLTSVIDYAFSKRVLIVSPVTFVIVARTVMESYRNFMVSDTLREIIIHIDEFMSEWERFRKKFEKYGRSINTLQNDYVELTSTRFRKMEQRIDTINRLRQGTVLPESN